MTGSVLPVQLNVGKLAEIEQFIPTLLDLFKDIDILVDYEGVPWNSISYMPVRPPLTNSTQRPSKSNGWSGYGLFY